MLEAFPSLILIVTIPAKVFLNIFSETTLNAPLGN
jgi:hypothetical protein